MSNKIICTLLLILFILLLLFIINRKSIYTLETFASNKWTTNKDLLHAENQQLNDVQKTQVYDMINSISESKLKSLITSQSPLLTGPAGPIGPQGPAGTSLIASGRLINKSGSFDSDKNQFLPQYVVTRTEGTSPTSSLSFMDNNNSFASFQNWQLDINNHLKNRYDNNCLTMDPKQTKLYIDKCEDSNPNQKWNWDNSNRIISINNSNSRVLKCIGLSKPEQNVITTNIPGCSGEQCQNNTPRRYLEVHDCQINNINEDEIWSFTM